jgi:2,3-bisphosphoglycerate-independent phosphoglycerate mutase
VQLLEGNIIREQRDQMYLLFIIRHRIGDERAREVLLTKTKMFRHVSCIKTKQNHKIHNKPPKNIMKGIKICPDFDSNIRKGFAANSLKQLVAKVQKKWPKEVTI